MEENEEEEELDPNAKRGITYQVLSDTVMYLHETWVLTAEIEWMEPTDNCSICHSLFNNYPSITFYNYGYICF